jgi:CRP-like cAMP-binding protein
VQVQYLYSMYWTLTTLTSIGYGDITPSYTSQIEQLFAITCMCAGASVFGYITANISSILENIDMRATAFKMRMNKVKTFLRNHRKQIPRHLAQDIKAYFQYYYSRKSAFDESQIIEELSPDLRLLTIEEANREVIDKLLIFKDEEKEFVSECIVRMRPLFCIATTILALQGEVGEEMFFIQKGIVEVIVTSVHGKSQIIGRHIDGAHFGEMALIKKIPRAATLRAATNCDLWTLSAEDLAQVLEAYPSSRKRMIKRMNKHYQEMMEKSKKDEKISGGGGFEFASIPELQGDTVKIFGDGEGGDTITFSPPVSPSNKVTTAASQAKMSSVEPVVVRTGDSVVDFNTPDREPPSPVTSTGEEKKETGKGIKKMNFKKAVKLTQSLQPPKVKPHETIKSIVQTLGTYRHIIDASIKHKQQSVIETNKSLTSLASMKEMQPQHATLQRKVSIFDKMRVWNKKEIQESVEKIDRSGKNDRMYSVQENMERFKETSKYVISMNNIHKIRWDIFVGSLIFLSIILVPLKIGFDYQESALSNAVDNIVDVCFFIDIILTFLSETEDAAGRPIGRFSRIAKMYLKTWFIIDFMSTIPLDKIVSLSLGDEQQSYDVRGLKLIRVARLIRLAKLLRLLKLGSKLEEVEDWLDYHIGSAFLELNKLLFETWFIAHLLACFMGYFGSPDISLGAMEQNTWLRRIGLVDASVGARYTAGKYFFLFT